MVPALALCWVAAAGASIVAACALVPAVASGAAEHPAVGVLNPPAPPLVALEDKLASRKWLVAWLVKPSLLRPGTTMPDSEVTAAEAQAMAAYLYSGSTAADDRGAWRGGDPVVGARLFVARGCRGCHAIAPAEASVSSRVPNLAGTGLKVRGDWLFAWIDSPRSYDANTAMPDLGLDTDEIRDLVAFLMERREGATVLAEATAPGGAGDPAAGKALLERYECGSCHRMRGFPDPEPALVLSAVGTEDRGAILRDGRLLVEFYNCRGCHRVEGTGGSIAAFLERKTLAPPTLEGEGARVQASWLIEFLQRPRVLRRWMDMRMPDYGISETRATALARYFAVQSHVSIEDEPVEEASADVTDYGLRRFAMFQCVQCHLAGEDESSDSEPDRDSIDLALAKGRLRPTWVREFLARPKALVGPATRMPSVFYGSDGAAKVADPERDIASIAAYLMHMTEPAEVALEKLEASRQHEERQQPIDWTTYEY